MTVHDGRAGRGREQHPWEGGQGGSCVIYKNDAHIGATGCTAALHRYGRHQAGVRRRLAGRCVHADTRK